jgi:apolipoprotein N-acyltransferase
MRALEFQKPVIRATNTGLSAVYDHGANEIMRLPFYQVSSGEVHLTPMVGSTPFGKYGLLIIFSIVSLMLSVSFLYLLMSIMTKERKLS